MLGEALRVFGLSYTPTPEVKRRVSLHENVPIEIGATDSFEVTGKHLQISLSKTVGLIAPLPEEGLRVSPRQGRGCGGLQGLAGELQCVSRTLSF